MRVRSPALPRERRVPRGEPSCSYERYPAAGGGVERAEEVVVQIFATRVWGFDPERWPVVVFHREADRDSLVRRAVAGDRLLVVATLDEVKVEPENRGRLLGLAEFGRKKVLTRDFVGREHMSPHDLDEQGEVRWPFALPIVRAWALTTKPLLREVLREQLPYNATSQAVLLDEQDAVAVMALPTVEIELPRFEKMTEARALIDALVPAAPGEVAAIVYALRRGEGEEFLVGFATQLADVLRDLNGGDGVWRVWLQQRFADPRLAARMSDRLQRELARHTSSDGRIRCAPKDVQRAWAVSVGG